MAYLAPIHRPSSVRHALKLRFLASDEECLIVAKSNRLEIYEQTVDGLSLRYSRAVYGKITVLNKLRPQDALTDHLIVATDRFMYFTLSWDAQKSRIRTEKSYVDLVDATARESQTGDRCLVDPSGRFMTFEFYEGVVTVVPIVQPGNKSNPAEIGQLGEPTFCRIEELFVRSAAFIQPLPGQGKKSKPRMALLYEDSQDQVELKIRDLDFTPGDPASSELVRAESAPVSTDMSLGASHLIPVDSPGRGVVILAEVSITYHDDLSDTTRVRPLDEATVFCAWEKIDAQRFVLADDYGRLYLLMLILNDRNEVSDWKLDVIGETSRASTLVYLDAGHVFVGSHQGDSQVIKIKETGIEIVQSFSNVAPILDFTVMDMGSRATEGQGQMNEFSSGQARIVTGSGAFKDGSLRSMRSGVGLEEHGSLGELPNIIDVFSLKASDSANQADTLLVSFIGETRAFSFSAAGEVEEKEDYRGLELAENTLLATNVPGDRILQVTPTSVRLSDSESGMLASSWQPSAGQTITAASASEKHALLSIGGSTLIFFDLSSDLSVVYEKTFPADQQVACVTLPQSLPVAIVGFWQNSSLALLSLSDFSVLHTESLSDPTRPSIPRSLLLVSILPDSSPTLFVALADGTVVSFTVDPSTYALSGRKSIILGAQQATFRALPNYSSPPGQQLYNVFAICEHPSLIYGSEGRIVYSSVSADRAAVVCPFDSAAYPEAIALAAAEDLKIAVVDSERRTHVQTLPIHQTVRRIAYSPALKAFGLGTISRRLQDGGEVVKSSFKLADEVMLGVLAEYQLNEEELVESVMRCELDDGVGGKEERFVVGTAYLDDQQEESVRGRIIVFEVTEDKLLKVVTEVAVKGACRCLAMVEGSIVAALIKTVVVYSFTYTTPSTPTLEKRASFRTSTAPIDLAVSGNLIAVADLMKSISIVQFKRGSMGAPDSLDEIARHFQTIWATAVAHIDTNSFIESDAEGNLLVLEHNVNGPTAGDRRRLTVTSEILLGEMVNRIRRIDVPALPDPVVVPRAFMATVEGSVYLFALIAESKRDLLIRLQEKVAAVVESPGLVPWNRFRAFKNQVREADEPFRFVDGDLLESFLDLDPSTQEGCVEGLGVGAEDVKALIEGLRRLH